MRTERLRFRTTLRRLEVLVAVVQCDGFRAAADRLGLSEAAVSRHMRQLEKELAVRLFQRRRGSAAGLTAIGTAAYREARELLEHANSLPRLCRRPGAAARTLQLWVDPQLDGFVAKAVAEYLPQHPGTAIALRQSSLEEIVDGLQARVCDIGYFLAAGPLEEVPSGLAWREPAALCAGAKHPALAGRAMTPAQLSEHPFVAPPVGTQVRRTVDWLLAAGGLTNFRVGLETNHAVVARESVAASRMLCLVSARLLTQELARFGVRCVAGVPLPPFEVRRCMRASLRHDPAVLELASFIDVHAAPPDARVAPAVTTKGCHVTT